MKKHPNKEINKALEYGIERGWRFEKSGKSGHAYGRLYCPEKSRSGCIISVWSTPRVPANHAKMIIKRIDKCSHTNK